MPHCHNSCSKWLQHQQFISGKLTQLELWQLFLKRLATEKVLFAKKLMAKMNSSFLFFSSSAFQNPQFYTQFTEKMWKNMSAKAATPFGKLQFSQEQKHSKQTNKLSNLMQQSSCDWDVLVSTFFYCLACLVSAAWVWTLFPYLFGFCFNIYVWIFSPYLLIVWRVWWVRLGFGFCFHIFWLFGVFGEWGFCLDSVCTFCCCLAAPDVFQILILKIRDFASRGYSSSYWQLV